MKKKHRKRESNKSTQPRKIHNVSMDYTANGLSPEKQRKINLRDKLQSELKLKSKSKQRVLQNQTYQNSSKTSMLFL